MGDLREKNPGKEFMTLALSRVISNYWQGLYVLNSVNGLTDEKAILFSAHKVKHYITSSIIDAICDWK